LAEWAAVAGGRVLASCRGRPDPWVYPLAGGYHVCMETFQMPTAEILRRLEALKQGPWGPQAAARFEALTAELDERPVQDIVTAEAELAK
jgi:hypothetical protein